MAADLYFGKLNLPKIKEVEGRAYEGRLLDVNIWVSDEPDQFGNTITITVGKKDEKKTYVGNAMRYVRKEEDEELF